MPTLVMIANSAATGPGAAPYVSGSQKPSGSSAALTPNTTSSSNAAARASPASHSGSAGSLTARSAKLSVPVTP